MQERSFSAIFEFPDLAHMKPRSVGRNMCLDDGLGILATREIFDVAGWHIDSIRLGRASAAVFPRGWLKAKAELCAEYEIDMQTGGPLYEAAAARGIVPDFLAEAADVGFTSVEFSENIISVPPEVTLEHLAIAAEHGLSVYFEYGRKYTNGVPFDPAEAADVMLRLLEGGVTAITVERAEVDLVIEDHPDILAELAERVGLRNLIFEAGPRTPHYPARFFEIFDPQQVNLGNIALAPANALDGVCIVANARFGLDRSVGYSFLRDIWKGNPNGSDPQHA
jgi:phosphosulfolactate synthase